MKFNINDYKGKYVMHCKTKEEAKDFISKHLPSMWHEGSCCWNSYKSDTVYFFNKETYQTVPYAEEKGYIILEWSNFMKKEFTKADFESGMVVECRNGERYLVLRDKLLNNAHWKNINNYTAEMKKYVKSTHSDDIMKVYNTIGVTNLHNIFYDENLILIWERQEVEEMTLAEVCKLLGKEIKIVK